MSHYDTAEQKGSATADRIDGPIPEIDKFDRYTGYDYYRCRRCGAEAMRRIDLEGCCL
jgi:hypothetical protein